MPSIPLPGETFTFSVPLVSQASNHIFQAAPTIAAGDFKRSINNGAFANMDNLPTVSPAAGKLVQIVVSASETTAAGEGGTIDIVGSDAAGAEWDDISICLRVGVIAANAAQLSGDAGAADNLELFFDGTGYASAGSINSVSGTVSANVVEIDGETVPVDNLVLALGTGGLVEKLNSMLEAAGLAYRFTAEALAEGPSGSGLTAQETANAVNNLAPVGVPAAGSIGDRLDDILTYGGGSGTGTYTDTIKDPSNNPLDGARVQLSTDAAGAHRVYEAFTNALGVFVMNPDPGTYYRWIDLAGYTDRLTQGAQVTVT